MKITKFLTSGIITRDLAIRIITKINYTTVPQFLRGDNSLFKKNDILLYIKYGLHVIVVFILENHY